MNRIKSEPFAVQHIDTAYDAMEQQFPLLSLSNNKSKVHTLRDKIIQIVSLADLKLNSKELELIIATGIAAQSETFSDPMQAFKARRYEYIKKSLKGASRTIIVDHQEQLFFILLKSKSSMPVRMGTYKRGSPAIAVWQGEEKVELVWQSVTKDRTSAKAEEDAFLEQKILDSCGKHPHLPHLLGAMDYIKTKQIDKFNTVEYEKTSYFYPHLNLSLGEYKHINKTVDDTLILACAEGVISGLHALYSKGWIHFDLALENIMVVKQTDQTYKAVLIDFDFSNKKEFLQDKALWYSRIRYTPPEMLLRIKSLLQPEERLPSTVNDPYYLDLEKIDVYAFGCILFELIYGDLLWKEELIEYSKTYETTQDADTLLLKQASLLSGSLKAIRQLNAGKYNKNNPSDVSQFLQDVCAALLYPNPVKRPNLMQIHKWIKNLHSISSI